MRLAIAERFLDDFVALPPSMQHKCTQLVKDLRGFTASNVTERATPGWRIHQLQSSPFLSFSLTMNYRLLGEFTGGVLVLHRVQKHDEADKPDVNRNADSRQLATVSPTQLQVADVYPALLALGVNQERASSFKACVSEDEFLEAAGASPHDVADLALSLFETSPLEIPRSRLKRLDPSDDDLLAALKGDSQSWELYLHPSQEFLARQPVTARLAVSGSAGTGKTVCAWYRCDYLIGQGNDVGFVCPNDSALAVSTHALDRLPSGGHTTAFLIPRSGDELAQLANAMDHVVVDEGQELPASWFAEMGRAMADSPKGVTLFFDFNQLGGHMKRGDTSRFVGKMGHWEGMIRDFKGMQSYTLRVNFRNSREIAQHYHDLLAAALPRPILGAIPAFEAGEVVVRAVSSHDLVGIVARTIQALLKNAPPNQVGVAIVRHVARSEDLEARLKAMDLPVTTRASEPGVFIAAADTYRGHERRAMVVLGPDRSRLVNDFGWAVDAYIALSRACAELIVLEVG